MTPTKICRVCGRVMEWRAKWSECWDEVNTCSKACRKQGIRPLDRQLEQLLMQRLDTVPRGKTLCPSEVPKALKPEAWKPLMPRTHAAARRLAHRGKLELVHRNTILDPSRARAPYEVRKR